MKPMINLLPATFRRQQILRRRIIQWTSIMSVVLVSVWIWQWYELREDRELTKQLDTLSREHAPTQAMLKHLVDMRQQLVELQQQESVAKELDRQRNALTLLGVISDAARKTNGRLRVNKFELKDFQGSQTSGVGAAKSGGLVLSGTSLDNPAVTELCESLKSSNVFSRVELLTVKEREDKAASLRDYEVRCEF